MIFLRLMWLSKGKKKLSQSVLRAVPASETDTCTAHGVVRKSRRRPEGKDNRRDGVCVCPRRDNCDNGVSWVGNFTFRLPSSGTGVPLWQIDLIDRPSCKGEKRVVTRVRLFFPRLRCSHCERWLVRLRNRDDPSDDSSSHTGKTSASKSPLGPVTIPSQDGRGRPIVRGDLDICFVWLHILCHHVTRPIK